jgi:hypothetical protein
VSLPPSALQTYEVLRVGVLSGQSRPEGLGAVIYHGMLRGLAVIVSARTPAKRALERIPLVGRPTPPEREFVRLLANMLLQTQSEAMHVY